MALLKDIVRWGSPMAGNRMWGWASGNHGEVPALL